MRIFANDNGCLRIELLFVGAAATDLYMRYVLCSMECSSFRRLDDNDDDELMKIERWELSRDRSQWREQTNRRDGANKFTAPIANTVASLDQTAAALRNIVSSPHSFARIFISFSS